MGPASFFAAGTLEFEISRYNCHLRFPLCFQITMFLVASYYLMNRPQHMLKFSGEPGFRMSLSLPGARL